MLQLYYADISALADDPGLYVLSSYRREKLLRQRSELIRRQGIGAELLLQRAVRALVPEIPLPPEIETGEYGKPCWPCSGLCFNLSHSGGYAACAVADYPVGLDIQVECVGQERLAKRFFSEDEYAAILTAEDRDAAFTRLWALKESYLKAVGCGLQTPLSSFSVISGRGCEGGASFWYQRIEKLSVAVCALDGARAEPESVKKITLP